MHVARLSWVVTTVQDFLVLDCWDRQGWEREQRLQKGCRIGSSIGISIWYGPCGRNDVGRRQRGPALAVWHRHQPDFPPPLGTITTAVTIIIAISI